MTIHMS